VEEREKLLAKVVEGPRSVRFQTLVKLMELWGFEVRQGSKGDIVIFTHRRFQVRQTAGKPHHGPVKSRYVKLCLGAIEQVQIQEGQTDA